MEWFNLETPTLSDEETTKLLALLDEFQDVLQWCGRPGEDKQGVPQNPTTATNVACNLVPRLFHLTAPAPEGRPWFRLVMCLPKAGRLPKQKLGEGRSGRKFA